MKHDISQLSKAFDSRIRLGIMSMLMVNEKVDFSTIKDMLNLTDGNLASHINALEKLSYIEVNKQFIGKKPNTSFSATELGRKAFSQHLDALEKLIHLSK
jgi:DNA-binding MarR family transcriptional regulator